MKQYLDLLTDIMENGHEKGDRTGTGTKSIFGTQMRFNLQKGFPLVTTKKLHMKSIIHELLWFIKGDTNVKYLQDNGVKIWNEWADENGDLGPVYGAQWRNWGTVDKEHEYLLPPDACEPIDQLSVAIERIKERPDCRRIIVTAWNPSDLNKMALAPCHCLFQFWTRPLSHEERIEFIVKRDGSFNLDTGILNGTESQEKEALSNLNAPEYSLSCQLYQRSCDTFLGVPFNIASYALLTHMVAQVTNTVPGDFIWTGGDTHIYNNHFEQVKTQLSREPLPLPTLWLNPDIKDINDFKYDDIKVENYQSHPSIKAPIAV